MGDAITTIAAVLVGGLLTYLVQARLDQRKVARERERDIEADARDRAREREAAEAEFAVAIRLILEELDSLALHHALLAAAGHYPLARAGPHMFPSAAWETEKRTLARGVQDEEVWTSLATFMHTIPRVRALVVANDEHIPIDPNLVTQFHHAALLARHLHQMLCGRPAPSVDEVGMPTDVDEVTLAQD